MATVTSIKEYGNQLVVVFSDGSLVPCYYETNDSYKAINNSLNVNKIQRYGNELSVLYTDGTRDFGYSTMGGVWYVNGHSFTVPLVDTISPGHSVTNPGGTPSAGWSWHIANESNRGGVDWNYSYGTSFLAPGPGTVTHFDVSGVGMVVKLVLDYPATRLHAQEAAGFDQFGPMQTVWFEHCSAAIDGHHNQGDTIGQSGDGYGAYPAHLHVNGLSDTANSAGTGNRCQFWGFV